MQTMVVFSVDSNLRLRMHPSSWFPTMNGNARHQLSILPRPMSPLGFNRPARRHTNRAAELGRFSRASNRCEVVCLVSYGIETSLGEHRCVLTAPVRASSVSLPTKTLLRSQVNGGRSRCTSYSHKFRSCFFLP
jgi:hypothetical protein